MENKLQKRYGLFTAICMVVGIVIGSGVFFKGQNVLAHTNGNVMLGVLAWAIGGAVMVICAYTFAKLSTKFVKVNGIVDYSEAMVGKKYAYAMGWFVSTIYYPAMTSVLGWVSARYTLELFGVNPGDAATSALTLTLGAFYLILAYALNILAPKIAGKFQVGTTVIKMVPLILMAVVGIIYGLVKGNTQDAFTNSFNSDSSAGFIGVLGAVCAAAFAYEGWIIATTINAELKEPKKHLPIALVFGTIIIVIVYIVYFLGVTGGADVNTLITQGSTAAFTNIFGKIAGKILIAFIVVSCWGTLNGLMLACTRAIYSVSVRKNGPKPEVFGELSKSTNMPTNSGVFALVVCGFWFFYFFAANLNSKPLFGVFSFDSSELPIITIYGMYLPIFIMFIIKEVKAKNIKGAIAPVLAIIASVFMMFAAVYAHGVKPFKDAKAAGEFSCPILFYLIVFAVIMAIGIIFYRKQNGVSAEEKAYAEESETEF